jgi:hypothetical protein
MRPGEILQRDVILDQAIDVLGQTGIEKPGAVFARSARLNRRGRR